jgi:DNA-binding GntR family transcriptional regulator
MTVSRSCLRQEIRDALVRRILEGELKPGDRLVELHLAEEFQTSQAPVREALRELEALGYVTTATYRGTRVREVPATEMRNAFRVRALLEREAAEAAARTFASDSEALRAAVDGIEAAAAAGDVKTYVRHDERFHHALVAGSGNPVLVRHWNLLLVPTRILVVIRSGIVDIDKTGKEHRPILEALERGDAELAGRRVYEHINRIAERLHEAAEGGGE